MKWRLRGKEDFRIGPMSSEGLEFTRPETIQSAASWRDLNLRQRSRLKVKNF